METTKKTLDTTPLQAYYEEHTDTAHKLLTVYFEYSRILIETDRNDDTKECFKRAGANIYTLHGLICVFDACNDIIKDKEKQELYAEVTQNIYELELSITRTEAILFDYSFLAVYNAVCGSDDSFLYNLYESLPTLKRLIELLKETYTLNTQANEN